MFKMMKYIPVQVSKVEAESSSTQLVINFDPGTGEAAIQTRIPKPGEFVVGQLKPIADTLETIIEPNLGFAPFGYDDSFELKNHPGIRVISLQWYVKPRTDEVIR